MAFAILEEGQVQLRRERSRSSIKAAHSKRRGRAVACEVLIGGGSGTCTFKKRAGEKRGELLGPASTRGPTDPGEESTPDSRVRWKGSFTFKKPRGR